MTAGAIKVERVVCAVDCGIAINPDIIRAQYGRRHRLWLGAVLYGAITLKDGHVEQNNFNDYRVLRMNEMPQVEVHIVPSQENPTGVGEPGVAPIGPAVANAIFAATGKRCMCSPSPRAGAACLHEALASDSVDGRSPCRGRHRRGGYEVFGPGKPTDFAGGKHGAACGLHRGGSDRRSRRAQTASLIERGEYLTRAADCVVCHTAKDGVPFAGGRAFVLPFGTLYSTNITPDADTGIGSYTDANFLDACTRESAAATPSCIPPCPMPATPTCRTPMRWRSRPICSPEAVHAPSAAEHPDLSLQPARADGPMVGLLQSRQTLRAESGTQPEWNRGAYLAEAMEHCGECHTPRNLAFALNNRKKFAGAVQAGWDAYNITPTRRAAWVPGAMRI
jgi:mono/diheme cytochrome c family protein